MQVNAVPDSLSVVDRVQPNHVDAVFMVINWFLIFLPVILIATGVILLVKRKTIAGVIILILALPLPLLLFFLSTTINAFVR